VRLKIEFRLSRCWVVGSVAPFITVNEQSESNPDCSFHSLNCIFCFREVISPDCFYQYEFMKYFSHKCWSLISDSELLVNEPVSEYAHVLVWCIKHLRSQWLNGRVSVCEWRSRILSPADITKNLKICSNVIFTTCSYVSGYL